MAFPSQCSSGASLGHTSLPLRRPAACTRSGRGRQQLTTAAACRWPWEAQPPREHAALTASVVAMASRGATASTSSPPSSSNSNSRTARPTTSGSAAMYELALERAREERFDEARAMFMELLCSEPHLCKAWVSWAQMEKRCNDRDTRFEEMRKVLQRGLALNPGSSCLIQAWGLMELQRGNLPAALMLLERSVKLDPIRCSPVLRWHQVDTARKTVGSRRFGRRTATAAQ